MTQNIFGEMVSINYLFVLTQNIQERERQIINKKND